MTRFGIGAGFFRLVAVIRQRHQRRNNVANDLALKLDLDAGLAGDLKARRRYEKNRIIAAQIPRWAFIEIERLTTSWAKRQCNHTQFEYTYQLICNLANDAIDEVFYYDESRRVKETRLRNNYWRSVLLNWAYTWRDKMLSLWQRLIKQEHSSLHDIDEARRETRQTLTGYHQLLKQLVALGFRAILLQDFDTLHHCSLGDKDWQTIITEFRHNPWKLLEIPLVHRILEAEAELSPVFAQLQATREERGEMTRRLVKGAITARSIERAIEWLKEQRAPKAVKIKPAILPPPILPTQPHPEPSSAPSTVQSQRNGIKTFIRGLSHLDRARQNEVGRYITKLHQEGLLDFADTLDELKNYTGDDHDTYIARRYLELTSTPSYKVVDAIPTTPVRLALEPQFTKPESLEEVLGRLDNSRPINRADILLLRKLFDPTVVNGQVAERVVRHIICYRLANVASSGRPGKHVPFRIHLETVPQRLVPPAAREIAQRVTKQLVDDGIIVRRDNSPTPPRHNSPVKLIPEVMNRYHAS
jgi:hypothetical protein